MSRDKKAALGLIRGLTAERPAPLKSSYLRAAA